MGISAGNKISKKGPGMDGPCLIGEHEDCPDTEQRCECECHIRK